MRDERTDTDPYEDVNTHLKTILLDGGQDVEGIMLTRVIFGSHLHNSESYSH